MANEVSYRKLDCFTVGNVQLIELPGDDPLWMISLDPTEEGNQDQIIILDPVELDYLSRIFDKRRVVIGNGSSEGITNSVDRVLNSKKKQDVYRVVKEGKEAGATSWEIGTHLSLSRRTISRTLTTLVKIGVLKNSGLTRNGSTIYTV